MQESTQEIVALALVGVVIALELLRRARKKKSGKASCDGCDTGKPDNGTANEAPVQFYKKNPSK